MSETADAPPHAALAQRSVSAILHNQRANGAIVASPDFSQYQFCWLRDGSFSAFALDVASEYDAAARYHQWVHESIQRIRGLIEDAILRRTSGAGSGEVEMPPARFTLDGAVVVDGWPNFQIDGYGTWLWSLGRHLDVAPESKLSPDWLDSIDRVARYLETFAVSPCFDVWEESGTAVHTSTLASVYAGLVSAAALLDDMRFLETAASVKVTLEGSARRLGYFNKSSESDDVDASVLWLDSPFRAVSSSDPWFEKTVSLIEDRLVLDGGLRRYPTDTYFGGGAWPVLTATLGWHYATIGKTTDARRCLDWVAGHFDREGRLGEQFGGEQRDRQHFDEWTDRWGPPAADLTWSHAMYVILENELARSDGTSAASDSRLAESNASAPEARP